MSARRTIILGLLASIHGLGACAGGADDASRDPPSGSSSPPFGEALQRVTSHTWQIRPVGDFNADRISDVLWYDKDRHLITVWLMRGTQLLAAGPDIAGPAGDGWQVIPTSDFNADEISDVLWIHKQTNRIAIWLMRGTGVLLTGPEIAGPPGDGWEVFSMRDINFDNMGDLLWVHAETGRISVWLMKGTRVLAAGPVIQR